MIDLVDLRFTRDELRRELSIDLVLPAVATESAESDQGRFLINFLTLLMTLFLMMIDEKLGLQKEEIHN